ncbi:MAG: replication restart helicase PriA [Burkholderiaceae bacterium]
MSPLAPPCEPKVVSVAVVAPGLGEFDYDWPPQILTERDLEVRSGDWLVVPFAKRVLLAVVIHSNKEPGDSDRFKRRQVLGRFTAIPSLTKPQIEFLTFIASYYRSSLGSVLSMVIPAWLRSSKNLLASCEPETATAKSPLQKLLQKYAADLLRQPKERGSRADPPSSVHPLLLTAEQQQAVEIATDSLGFKEPCKNHAKPVYVQGVTGSGKTLVYVELIKRLWQINPEAQVLYLVPEIALTPVLKSRLLDALSLEPEALSILHSGMTDRQRASSWMQAAHGVTQLILGTRLSLMTPLPRLAMIVVDEEHDSSYKSQDSVRYSARDLAAYLASQQSLRLVMGSATPSLESLAQIEKGRYRLVRLLKQATGAPRAALVMVDLNKERMACAGVLTDTVHKAVEETLGRGRQVLFFLNRRGYAPLLSCPSCGWTQGCEHCSVSMVLHKKTRQWQMICHHCGIVKNPQPRCPSCGAAELTGQGFGIQSLEEQLAAVFPGVALTRVDSDSAGTMEKMTQMLKQLQQPKPEIILATQILAKGHDLPGLSTVVVLDVDAQLLSPEFRAPEWLFSTLLQVSGRAGRHEDQARVFLQTRYPTHPLFQGLKGDDPASYLHALLEERRQALLPPYGHIAALRMTARTELAVQDQFNRLYEALVQSKPADCQVHRPSPSYPEKRANQYRWHMVLESSRRGPLNAGLELAMAIAQAQGLRDLIIDVDPLGLS